MANASEVIAALSDPTRRAIFERLAEGPRSVGDIASGLPVSRPAVSQHLKVLQDAGLVFHTRDGTRRHYQINPAGVESAWRYFDRLWNSTLAAFKDAAERKTAKRRRRHDNRGRDDRRSGEPERHGQDER